MKYKVAKRLGSGGFGNVYEVQASDGNIYAMKLLKDLSPANKQRFEREIKILAQLNHPNIVKIVEWNLGGDPPDFSPWYTMEYLRGGSLRDHMDHQLGNSPCLPCACASPCRVDIPPRSEAGQYHVYQLRQGTYKNNRLGSWQGHWKKIDCPYGLNRPDRRHARLLRAGTMVCA